MALSKLRLGRTPDVVNHAALLHKDHLGKVTIYDRGSSRLDSVQKFAAKWQKAVSLKKPGTVRFVDKTSGLPIGPVTLPLRAVRDQISGMLVIHDAAFMPNTVAISSLPIGIEMVYVRVRLEKGEFTPQLFCNYC